MEGGMLGPDAQFGLGFAPVHHHIGTKADVQWNSLLSSLRILELPNLLESLSARQ